MVSRNQPSKDEMMTMAVEAAKSGNKEGARMMFRRILAEDKRNERAIMWLAKLAPQQAERKRWLQNALKVNPDNETARRALDQMAQVKTNRENQVLYTVGYVLAGLVGLAVLIFLIVLILP